MGIPQDSIDKIWQRFYKTDLSRGRDKTGSGIGLAIVKEIIMGHNENNRCNQHRRRWNRVCILVKEIEKIKGVIFKIVFLVKEIRKDKGGYLGLISH